MATRIEKKNIIRDHIIDSADVYSHKMAGKTFLYVYGDSYFEVSFPIDFIFGISNHQIDFICRPDP